MRIKSLVVSLIVVASLFAGCAPKGTTPGKNGATPKPAVTATPNTDATTTASIVNTQDAFLNAVSAKGTWIIAILNDMTIDQDITVEGPFKNRQGKVFRKLAFYTQDANRNVTARFTLKAPKMTVRSENTSIQHGTFLGDVYVEANGFNLLDAKVDGNIYFASDEYKNSFTKDATSSVTGTADVKK